MPALLRLQGVGKAFGGVHALHDVSLELRAGEVHALIGENGAGKSTLVRIVTGALAPDSGSLEIGGQAVSRADPQLARSLGVAPIYQQPALFPDLSVAENLAIGLERGGAWRRIDWRARRERAATLLARVGAEIALDAPARSLRMAEQQLVEIARAFGAEARVLLMDEPSAALTDRETERLFALIADWKRQGAGILYVSHRLEEVEALADRVTVLRDGQLVATRPMAGTTRGELIRLMVGREIHAAFPKRAVPIGAVALEAAGLGCGACGIQGVDLTLRAGEIVGLAGLVGSGRTELARILYGLTPADAGELRVAGRPTRIGTPAQAVAHGLAYVPEDRRRYGVVPEMSVAENASLAALRRIARNGWIDRRRERALAGEFVERFAIKTPSLEAQVGTLSGGNQQKVALARALATRPRVLILDEPTQGVDVGAKSEIHRLMVELAEQGLAILMISSELPEIFGMSDRIGVMRGRRLVATLDRADATPELVLARALGHAPATGSGSPDAEAVH